MPRQKRTKEQQGDEHEQLEDMDVTGEQEPEPEAKGHARTSAVGEEERAGADAPLTMLELLKEQQRAMLAQQQEEREHQRQLMAQQRLQHDMLLQLVEEQKQELTRYRGEIQSLKEGGRTDAGAARAKLPKPTLQKLGPDDDIENFIATFERIARQQNWPEEVWATQLAGLLTGKAMAAYAGLGVEQASSYDDVKAAILRRYEINEETHRVRFRRDKKTGGETYREWMDRLQDHFRRWIKNQTMPLEDVMVMEQFLQGVPEDLRVWLKEKKPESLQGAAELADDYVLVRRGEGRSHNPAAAKGSPWPAPPPSRPAPEMDNRAPPRNPTWSNPAFTGRSRTNTRGDKRCYHCGKYGHLMFSCPSRDSARTQAMFAGEQHEVAWNSESQKHLCRGHIDGRPVRMLVDTGCDMTMVSSDWVHPSQVNLKERMPVLCVHGDTHRYPTASVLLEVEGIEQRTKVIIAPDLPVPVLLGRDLCDLKTATHPGRKQGLVVITRAQKRRQQQESAERQTLPTPVGLSAASEEEDSQGTDRDPEPENIEMEQTKGDIPDPDIQDEDAFDSDRESEAETQVNGKSQTSLPESDHSLRREESLFTTDSEARREPNIQEPLVSQEIQDQSHSILEATPEQLKKWQEEDPTLTKARELARQGDSEGDRVAFYYKDGILYRQWRPRGTDAGDVRRCEQLVLPRQCRSLILRVAHDIPMAGHLGTTKTKDRILQRYYWPGIFKEIAEYCRSCDVCQRSHSKRPARGELVPMPVVAEPFHRIAMDIIGPLPKTARGNRFILTICDYATRYPEAIPLPVTDAPRIARELVNVFARVGVPSEILTDQGSNFMSTLLQEVYHFMQIKRIRTSPYHPQTDGLVERFNGTLKAMLQKFVSRSQKDWDNYLPYLLFAYREVPQESTGFSPFELLYGRRVRGPLDVLREAWAGEEEGEAPLAVHVIEMRDRLQDMTELVQEHMEKSQERQKAYYDRHTRERQFEKGDRVLVLLPMTQNRLKLKWTGPYRVSRKISDVDYEVETPGRRREKRVYHINLLKKWHDPSVHAQQAALFGKAPVTREPDQEEGEEVEELFLPTQQHELQNVLDQGDHLRPKQADQLRALANDFPSVFAAKPGRTTLVKHSIHVGNAAPIHQKSYRLPYSRREALHQELDKMLEGEIIRPSTSPWASPVVLVPKKDGGIRFCVDYRKLNSIAKFDAYPMPRAEEVFERVGNAKVISTLDLSKGYWQIPMEETSREMTAFATPFGLYEFEVMPFGLHNAPATFQRLINHVLRGGEAYSSAYIDDIVVFSQNWEDHFKHLRDVFTRLQTAGLTLRADKCRYGLKEAHYLGHVIGGGKIKPDEQKVKAVKDYPTPTTKKDVRAFLGLTGYYRKFIPHFATVAAPLTDLTRKGHPEKIEWGAACEESFQKLKGALQESPVLKIAEPDRPFIVQIDASDRGLGAVLSQRDTAGLEHPVAFASRKLYPREEKYAVVEKECLAIVWALKVFHTYLYGQQFSIESDHQPLAWLQRMKNANGRLTRWALSVQQYSFSIKHRAGSENKNADGLSRGPICYRFGLNEDDGSTPQTDLSPSS